MYSAKDIAIKLIRMADEDIANGGDCLTNLKLQKLLYYEQGYHLASFGTPLFSEPIEAWMYGPVVPAIYDNYQQYGAGPLPIEEDTDVVLLSKNEESLFYQVYDAYKILSGIGLMNQTHQEKPWTEARPHNRGTIITQEAMRNYFKTKI